MGYYTVDLQEVAKTETSSHDLQAEYLLYKQAKRQSLMAAERGHTEPPATEDKPN